MIRFSLHCDQAHEFEIWFGSNADYDRQREKGLVSCPVCGSGKIEKSLMAPAISKSDKGRRETANATAPAPSAPADNLAFNPHQAEMMKAIHEMVRQVRASSENVGERFPEEARKIHHGEAKERGIIGKASPDEARALIEEGIGIAPLPDLPEDLN